MVRGVAAADVEPRPGRAGNASMSSTVRWKSARWRRPPALELEGGMEGPRCSPRASPLAVARKQTRGRSAAACAPGARVEQRVIEQAGSRAPSRRPPPPMATTQRGRCHRPMLPSTHDQDRLRGDARAVPSHPLAGLVRPRPRTPVSRPGSWSASTSIRGPRSKARARSAWGLHGRTRWADVAAVRGPPSPARGSATTRPLIAHAAATLGAMYPGRFYLGLGAGEALNEHVIGGVWPEVPIRSRDDVRGHRDHQQAVHG